MAAGWARRGRRTAPVIPGRAREREPWCAIAQLRISRVQVRRHRAARMRGPMAMGPESITQAVTRLRPSVFGVRRRCAAPSTAPSASPRNDEGESCASPGMTSPASPSRHRARGAIAPAFRHFGAKAFPVVSNGRISPYTSHPFGRNGSAPPRDRLTSPATAGEAARVMGARIS